MEIPSGFLEHLDLERAWRRVYRNRPNDFVVSPISYVAVNAAPQVLLRIISGELGSGAYSPRSIRVIDVLKPNHTLRPGAVLDIRDRVLYQALVDTVADGADARLLSAPTVFGFQLNPDPDSAEFLLRDGYGDFRDRIESEYDRGYTHILETDVAAYYESIRPRFLQQALVGLGVDSRIVRVLTDLMSFWSSAVPYGLPQGPWSSDYLGARVYLDRIDKAMLHAGHRFFRFSDDVRVSGRRGLHIRTALRDLIIELRAIGLHVQSAKTRLLSPTEAERRIRWLHERLAARGDLGELLGLDQYGYVSPEETLADMTDDEIVRSQGLLNALEEDVISDRGAWDHELCRFCINGYRRIGSPDGLQLAVGALKHLPELTRDAVRYLRGIVDAINPRVVRDAAVKLLRSRETIHDWQRHWLLHLLNEERIRNTLRRDDARLVSRLASDGNQHAVVREMATKVVGRMPGEASKRALVVRYADEPDIDVKHAILAAARGLGAAERNAFYSRCEGIDPVTDLVISYVRGLAPHTPAS